MVAVGLALAAQASLVHANARLEECLEGLEHETAELVSLKAQSTARSREQLATALAESTQGAAR